MLQDYHFLICAKDPDRSQTEILRLRFCLIDNFRFIMASDRKYLLGVFQFPILSCKYIR